jgi:hypothetical protein
MRSSPMSSSLNTLVRKMSTKHNTSAQTGTDDFERSIATTMGVDLLRVMPDVEKHDYAEATSTDTEQPKVIRMGISLTRKLFHYPRDEHSNSPPRVDSIFDVHATNKEHSLRRRRTTESLQRPKKHSISKLDISKPMTSPPAPDETLVRRYEKRQSDWKKRSLSFKSKRLDSVKRWSWKPWTAQTGQENVSNTTSFTAYDNRETKKLSPRDPIREVEDVHGHGSFARERARRIEEFRSAGLEISIKPVSNGAATSRDQRRNPLTSPTNLSVIKEQQSQPSLLHPTHYHSASASHIPRQYSLRNQGLTKSASTGMLRPGDMHGSHLDIPSLSRTSSANDQRHIHPALRAQRSSDWVANDQRHIHPTLRTQPSATLRANDQRHIHPTLRTKPSSIQSATDQRGTRPAVHSKLDLRATTTKQRPLPPTPRAQPSTISLNTINTTVSAPPIIRSVPRVRIIPPTPLIGTNDRPTAHAKLAVVNSKPPTPDEQKILVANLNASRATVSAAPLELHSWLSAHAQNFVAFDVRPSPVSKLTPAFKRHESLNMRESRQRATQIEQVDFMEPSGASAIRLISPTGLGVLACAELWAGGKYKRHKTVRNSHVPWHHRYSILPPFVSGDVESMVPMVSDGHGHGHKHSHSQGSVDSSWCVCAEYDAWKTVTDKRWKSVGVGCSKDGRWVVELCGSNTTDGAARSF